MIYDSFMFHSEFPALSIRLRELSDVVDHFILVEASRTHTGIAKPYYFEEYKYLFAQYADKIIHKKLDLYDDPGFTPWQNWGREAAQRLAVNTVLADRGAALDDVVLYSDVDEIPRARVIEEYKGRTDICCIEETNYHYNLNCKLEAPTIDPKICRYEAAKRLGIPDLRYYHHPFPATHIIRNGGWHLSYMGGTDKIIEKVKSYAHYDPRDPKMETYISRDNIEACIKERKSLFFREDVKYLYTKDYSDMPKYIVENFQNFIEMGWIVDP